MGRVVPSSNIPFPTKNWTEPNPFLDVGLKNTTNIRRITRGFVVMGRVLHLVTGLGSIKRGHPEKDGVIMMTNL